MATATASEVKYLLLPISVNPNSDGMSPTEAEEVVKGYLNRGFVISATTINLTKDGMNVAHVLVK